MADLAKEGSHVISPKFRKGSKYGIFGNYRSKGGDKVTPPDWCFAIAASLFTAIPSSYIIVYTIPKYFSSPWWVIIDVIYTCSLLNLMRLVYLCSHTEPGVIPAIPGKNNDAIFKRESITVEYKREVERHFDGERLQHFYSDNVFKFAKAVDPDKEMYTLSLCTTCMIIRPPRAFHCSTCNVCVES